MDLFFDAVNPAGEKGFVKCNDMVFDYYSYRKEYPEYFCIDLINAIKRCTRKKAAIIFGNCQTLVPAFFLPDNSTFSKEYFLIRIPTVCEFKPGEKTERFQENFWSTCDLLISQRVKKDNKFAPEVATRNLPARLPEDTKIIWIPNVYFDGYFPQRTKNFRNVDLDKHIDGKFPHGDKYVDAFMTVGGRSIAELTEFLREQKFISEGEVKNCVERSFDELKKHEWACDIRDKILKEYEANRFFWSFKGDYITFLQEYVRRCWADKLRSENL